MKHTIDSEGDGDFDDGVPEYHPEADDAGVFRCPNCHAEMYGDSPRCPSCGDYVTPGARASLPWWIWIALILVGLGLVVGIARSIR
ncbi:MAG: hypothetical protein HY293_15030 [Planctomycetes bacterium]|nr:hypothetical protein [Planctomycetota bacterium]